MFYVSTALTRSTRVGVALPLWVLVFVAPVWLALVLVTFEIECALACCVLVGHVASIASRELRAYRTSRAPAGHRQ